MYIHNDNTFYLQVFMFTAKTHLFVHDPDHLLDYPTPASKHMPPRTWNLMENEKEVIHECKPTHPDVQMTFLNNKKENITSKLHDYNMEYDPKIGLIFKKVRKSDVYKIGMLTCEGTMDGKTSEAKFSLMVGSQVRLKDPIIKRASIYNYPVHNGNSTFTCTNLVTNFDKGAVFDVGKTCLL